MYEDTQLTPEIIYTVALPQEIYALVSNLLTTA